MKHLALPKRLLLMIVVAGVVLAIAPCVFADTEYTENISLIGQTTQACTPACTGPFATMSVDLTSLTTAVITLTGDSNGTYQYLIGDDSQALALNIDATNASVSGISATYLPGFTANTYTPKYYFASPQGYDSLGYFNLNINGSGAGYDTAATEISFTVTDLSGSWGSAYEVLTSQGNDYGHDVGLPWYACPLSDCTASPTLSEDGHGTAGAAPVPEPASIALLGGVLLVLLRP